MTTTEPSSTSDSLADAPFAVGPEVSSETSPSRERAWKSTP
eukprot:CAMPEP_0168423044 /NCGR_PEP_ID=MMETSP0228-20121227/34104_1 /TAXON_ID=133427 /ORGANISM="Protoceratium reticulatum, Strain CCCM 535 (=CCMP 1889)" /LENGTH=40 /DNA_ID= /DNA_START= /DNA_END= /DNA_ORIENTATION=